MEPQAAPLEQAEHATRRAVRNKVTYNQVVMIYGAVEEQGLHARIASLPASPNQLEAEPAKYRCRWIRKARSGYQPLPATW